MGLTCLKMYTSWFKMGIFGKVDFMAHSWGRKKGHWITIRHSVLCNWYRKKRFRAICKVHASRVSAVKCNSVANPTALTLLTQTTYCAVIQKWREYLCSNRRFIKKEGRFVGSKWEILASILHHCKDSSWCMHIACSIAAAHLHVIDIDGTVWPDWKSSGPAKI